MLPIELQVTLISGVAVCSSAVISTFLTNHWISRRESSQRNHENLQKHLAQLHDVASKKRLIYNELLSNLLHCLLILGKANADGSFRHHYSKALNLWGRILLWKESQPVAISSTTCLELLAQGSTIDNDHAGAGRHEDSLYLAFRNLLEVIQRDLEYSRSEITSLAQQ